MTKARSNATAEAAKGDLRVGNGTNLSGILGVGSNGDTIVADSSTSTGLRYTGNYAAGKNKIINGDFGIWQRGTTVSIPNVTDVFGPDRFNAYVAFTGGTSSWTQQTFTPGTAPVAGYEGQYFARITCGSTSSYTEFGQRIEDVRTFAGQTVTFSFWAKASASLVFTPYIFQRYGSGGSAQTAVNGSAITLTTSWTRYTVTLAVPSISGKTIGTSSSIFASLLYNSGTLNSATIDLWGWQVEAGSVATAFQTATGTIQGELAACQRYYYRQTADATNPSTIFGFGMGTGSTSGRFAINLLTTMRTTPTSLDYNALGMADGSNAPITITNLVFLTNGAWNNNCGLTATVASGATQYRPYYIVATGGSGGFLGLSAEL